MARRTLTPEYAEQLEARARDARAKIKAQQRKDTARLRILLGALVLQYAEAQPDNATRLLQAFGLVSPLRAPDLAFLSNGLPVPLANALQQGHVARQQQQGAEQ